MISDCEKAAQNLYFGLFRVEYETSTKLLYFVIAAKTDWETKTFLL